jgi:hypothetical protein
LGISSFRYWADTASIPHHRKALFVVRHFIETLKPMAISKKDILFWTGIVTAIWFAWTGMVWTYNAALLIAYPIGLISYLIWRNIRKDNYPRNKFIPRILLFGLTLSLSVLVYLLIFD